MTLGARWSEVAGMIVGQAAVYVIAGVIVGLAGAFAGTRLMTGRREHHSRHPRGAHDACAVLRPE